jgi:hypothetical protein
MAEFKSASFSVDASHKVLSEFLSIPSNLLEIFPADRIEDWKSEGESCSFKIKGLSHISLRLLDKKEGKVIYENTSAKPFPFKLNINMADAGNGKSSLDANFDAEVNSFMSMMLQKPLTAFLNSLGELITKKYSES